MTDDLIKRLLRAPLYEASGEENDLPDEAAARIRELEAERDAAVVSRDEWKRGWYALDQDTKADLSQCRKRAEAAEAERDEWKRRHFKMRDERDKAQIASANYANFSHEWRQRAEAAKTKQTEADALAEVTEACLRMMDDVLQGTGKGDMALKPDGNLGLIEGWKRLAAYKRARADLAETEAPE